MDDLDEWFVKESDSKDKDVEDSGGGGGGGGILYNYHTKFFTCKVISNKKKHKRC